MQPTLTCKSLNRTDSTVGAELLDETHNMHNEESIGGNDAKKAILYMNSIASSVRYLYQSLY
jgi:hypothetical protein